MAERNVERAQAQQAQFDDYVRETAGSGGGAAAEIEKAKGLLDSGAHHAGRVRRDQAEGTGWLSDPFAARLTPGRALPSDWRRLLAAWARPRLLPWPT